MKTIKERIAKAQDRIIKWHQYIRDIQMGCVHPDLIGKYNSNTGNWCPQDDSYWLDLNCPDCGKRWSVDSNNPEYRLYGIGRDPKYKCTIKR